MIGALASLAASSDATTVEEEVTLMAGMAKLRGVQLDGVQRLILLTSSPGHI